MKESDSTLTLKELEILCNLYLECRLSALEERELEYIIQNSSRKSPIILEVKKIMGYEDMEYLKFKHPVKSEKRTKILSKIISCAAASVIILFISGFLFFKSNNSTDSTRLIYCKVYANGKEVNPEKALEIANENLERMVAFEEKIKMIEMREKEKVENFNIINKRIP